METHSAQTRPDDAACYAALKARDARFDGRFFTGVTSTGIYCRPICPARLPKRENCTFHSSAAAAEAAGFRACLRCRPEAAPGTPAARGAATSVDRAVRLIGQGALDDGCVPDLADRLGIGERHLRRLFKSHLGASPEAVAATRRLLLAKQLLSDTTLSVADIAFASGYSSLRRFNDAFRKQYRMPPTALRREAQSQRMGKQGSGGAPFDITLSLGFRPPFDWEAILSYFSIRMIPRVEMISDRRYRRTAYFDDSVVFLEAWPHPRKPQLMVRVLAERPFPLGELVTRVRRLFDLDADPAAISAHFQNDPLLGPLTRQRPGLRIPGAFDGFELAVRAILGQQVSVKGATTLAGRLVERYGQEVASPPGPEWPDHLFPTPAAMNRKSLNSLGLPTSRADTLRGVASAAASGSLTIDPAQQRSDVLAHLNGIKGIGPWTLSYVALRALNDPDAFPVGDLGLQKAAAPEPDGRLTAKELGRLAEAWTPWRGYAALHLWQSH